MVRYRKYLYVLIIHGDYEGQADTLEEMVERFGLKPIESPYLNEFYDFDDGTRVYNFKGCGVHRFEVEFYINIEAR
jgi:hypothetical protein